ncbi:uncharacterized protein G2W53_019058 [Senna tora]|uniref:Uncharacterized protein n=1 Tax=Senna tora TaxID=362788 RepID=A0A834U1M7_9FABA|nr:uncharacterized protein G2W53_019058 [Senna tora]
MYVTRPRSLYKRDREALSVPPPEGPNSGYLVIQDEEAETYSCFGMWKKKSIGDLPLPQNKNLTVVYSESSGDGVMVFCDKVIFIPVINHPLSSNRYYVIRRKGKHQGEACTCSKEEDMATCLCCNYIKDIKAKPLNPSNEFQHFEIIKRSCGFYAKSITSHAFPPHFLRRKHWTLCSTTPHHYHLVEALGLDPSLRAKLPPFTFPSSSSSSEPVVIGKWYCPFMFVKEEGVKVKEQMKRSVFYEMTLEQKWEKVFSKENNNNTNNEDVFVDVVVKTEGSVWEEGKFGDDGVMWFRSVNSEGEEKRVGLSMAIVERMRWEEEERGGWVGKKEKQVRFERVEKFEGINGKWESFGFYVLVESFVLKRMDGSLVLTCDFMHTHHVRCKWV